MRANGKPVHYTLEFEPNFTDFTFTGKETVRIVCKSPTSTLRLNAAELNITKSSVTIHGKTHEVKTKTKTSEELLVFLGSMVTGELDLHLEFSGKLNDRLLGFYRSKYTQNGKTKYLATTQFEAADARRAFPCWDNPAAKATFDISITTDDKNTAISNMPIVSRKKRGKKIRYKFDTTPVMSTYLVYLGVGDFEFLTGRQDGIAIRVATTRGNKSKGAYALSLAKRLVKSYGDYFGIKYPLPKLDLIAVPDFAAGAMENWGAITFRETILLYDPATSSTRTKQFIAEVVSHEIAHQWFGNLVTMKWWNDLWLNESFATFMATKFVDKIYPDWDLWDQFIEDAMNTAMGLDSLKSTHPIDVDVKSPSEIREIFDAISYDKGGCILRMLEDFVTESRFRAGLRAYLKEFKYGNAEGADLWKAIGKAARLPVKSMVDTWIKQPGFPLLEAKRRNKSLSLQQRRFMGLDSQREKWAIPVSVRAGKKIHKKLQTRQSDSIQIGDAASFVVNHGRYGFYRVKYDQDTLYELGRKIKQESIPHIDRWAIQNDLYAMCISGEEPLYKYLEFTTMYDKETNYLVSTNVASNLYSLQFRTRDEPYADMVKSYAVRYFEKMFDRLGWDAKRNEIHTDALLRGLVISSLGRLGDKKVTDEAVSRFQRFQNDSGSLPADLRESVYSLAAWSQGSKVYKKLMQLYKDAVSQEERVRLLGAMYSFNDYKLLQKSLEFSLTDGVRSQNMHLPIVRVASNPAGRDILWPWLKKNWITLGRKVGHGNPLLNRIVASLSLVADKDMKPEIRQFFIDNPVPGTERTLAQTLERIQINSKFLARTRKELQVR